MDEFKFFFIVLNFFFFGSETVVECQFILKSGKPVGDKEPLAYQIVLYDGSCLQYDRIIGALTGVPCDSNSHKQQFRHIPINSSPANFIHRQTEVPYNSLRHESALPAEAAEIDILKNSAFEEQYNPDQSDQTEENNTIIFKNLDFGQFGASQVALKFKSADVLTNVNEEIAIQLGDAQITVLTIDLQANVTSSSSLENVLSFDLETINGTHDMLLTLPSELRKNDLVSIRFKRSDSDTLPAPEKRYYVKSSKLPKVLTISLFKWPSVLEISFEIACIRPLGSSKTQQFRFVEMTPGQYKIVEIYTDHVLEADDNPEHGYSYLMAKSYNGLPSQIWYLKQNENGWVFRSKVYDTKCLTIVGNGENFSDLKLEPCDDQGWQTWRLLEVFP